MSNSLVREYMPATFFAAYQAMRDQLMAVLTDEDLDVTLGGATERLGSLCREIGDIEHAYVQSFRTFTQDFSYRNPDPAIERSVADLKQWYTSLDRDLLEAVGALSAEDIANRRIARSDFDVDFFSPLPAIQLDTYREALLIFYGKASIYLRAMDRDLPGDWADWIG